LFFKKPLFFSFLTTLTFGIALFLFCSFALSSNRFLLFVTVFCLLISCNDIDFEEFRPTRGTSSASAICLPCLLLTLTHPDSALIYIPRIVPMGIFPALSAAALKVDDFFCFRGKELSFSSFALASKNPFAFFATEFGFSPAMRASPC